ncbi:decarboxylase [Candidatus Woesearchaeota archaeon]|jgi:ornithine decarboxylase|nr:decarboxylase [Candidatus Woesearchaeota archaeon]MBT4111351.1 decarboxylase [Candidatus Woesearchaeota archaeon]MBT4336470.1 decarboxylase [Candidatus Woesearchaeota archaeon]MBT4469883.1 decarboxylase [Candidatus Woesearchaeota archaeon]MBT6744446.1 decarboxylase [Candidatus Woesearchaeota archaeon]
MNDLKFLISKSKVLSQFGKVKQLADFVSYSSKTNQTVTKILENEVDCMFSVHSVNELKHNQDLSRVIFLAQGWNEEEIRSLVEKRINWFVVDNESDLDVLLSFLEKNEVKINLLLRLKLKELSVRTERYFVFGMTSAVINKRVKELRNNSKIGQLGIHFHRKTQNMAEWKLQYELSNILDEDVLEMIDLVNIGGGLPSEYANTNVKVLPGIFNKITELKQWLNQKGIQLMIEPGRFIAASAGKLVTKIIAIHENNIIVNASVYNANMDAVIVPVKLLVEGELTKEEGKSFVIKGVTPCSMDLFRYRVYLDNPKVGDQLVFLNAGAYNFTTNFCDLEEIETEVVE